MARYVAFLKGMNLGNRRITNVALCKCFMDIGLGEASAFLASGNVLFNTGKKASALEPLIETGLHHQLSYRVKTFVRSAAEVATIATHRPFTTKLTATLGGKLQVALLGRPPGAAVKKAALALQTPDDALSIEGRELYWLPRGNLSDSELDVRALARILGPMTIRTQRTLTRLADKLHG